MTSAHGSAALRWSGYVAVAIVFAVACAFLSNWQFERNAERGAQLALVEANYDAAPVPLDELLPRGAALDPGDEWRPVVLEGAYLPDDQVLVRNRPHGGTAAFEVLVPFRLDDGRVVVVSRGWVPPGVDQADPDVVPAPPSGQTRVVVRLRPSEPIPGSGRSAPGGQVPTLNLDLVAAAVGPDAARLETGAWGALASEDPAPAQHPQLPVSPSSDPGPHLSYAIQWILFAAMGFIFIGYVIRTERRHRREDAEDATPRRPRDRDTVEEDALLDRVGR